MDVWRNPELVRHLRIQLRHPRPLAAMIVTLLICALVGLLWGAGEIQNIEERIGGFYFTLLIVQYVVLGLWTACACGTAIVREREMKTFDSWRTTRLTSGELIVGMLLGKPILASFAVGCSLPISIVSGLLAGYSLGPILITYGLLTVFALFAGLLGLWLSMLSEKSSSGAAPGLLIFVALVGSMFVSSPFTGLGTLSLYPALLELHEVSGPRGMAAPTLFGWTASFVPLTLMLHVALGAWLAIMLSRNLKKDVDDIRLLSRWQAVGLAAFLNVLFYAFLNVKLVSSDVAVMIATLNFAILYAVGFLTLAPYETLRIWWRRHASGKDRYLSENGLPWPWLLVSAIIGFALMVLAALLSDGPGLSDQWNLGTSAIQMFTLLVFICRDILFLQWCRCTAMKKPMLTGVVDLMAFYLVVSIAGLLLIRSDSFGSVIFSVLTPFGAFNPDLGWGALPPSWFVGIGIQIGVILMLLNNLHWRLGAVHLRAAAATS